jgi:hypothetical protein
MSSHRNKFVIWAASGFALAVGATAPRAALAADQCTHGTSKTTGITGSGTKYTYISGSWQYVGSQLLHVHKVDKRVIRFWIEGGAERQTIYCSR